MRRALMVLVALAAVTALAFWFAEIGGTIEVQVGELWIGIGLPIAVLILVAAFILFHAVLAAFAAAAPPAGPSPRRPRRSPPVGRRRGGDPRAGGIGRRHARSGADRGAPRPPPAG